MLLRRQASLRRRPSQERSSFTFESILDAAQHVVLAEGAEALQMSMLVRRAGVSAGTLYQYFPDKTSVLMALDDRSAAQLVAHLRQTLETARDASLDSFLEVMSASLTELALRDHRLRLALRADLQAAGNVGELVDCSEDAAMALAEALRSKVTFPEERLLALCRLMVWAADGLIEGALRRPEPPAAELRTALLSAWRGIVAHG